MVEGILKIQMFEKTNPKSSSVISQRPLHDKRSNIHSIKSRQQRSIYVSTQTDKENRIEPLEPDQPGQLDLAFIGKSQKVSAKLNPLNSQEPSIDTSL